MEGILLAKSDNTPLVEGGKGYLKMDGVALPENPRVYFNSIFNWIKNYDHASITVDVNLYYFNTAVSKLLLEMFKTIEANEYLESISVNWHYEDDDYDMLDSGEMYESNLQRTHFEYFEYAEAI